MNNFQCRTVGELLQSIEFLIGRGEYFTARKQAAECLNDPRIANVELPRLDDEDTAEPSPAPPVPPAEPTDSPTAHLHLVRNHHPEE